MNSWQPSNCVWAARNRGDEEMLRPTLSCLFARIKGPRWRRVELKQHFLYRYKSHSTQLLLDQYIWATDDRVPECTQHRPPSRGLLPAAASGGDAAAPDDDDADAGRWDSIITILYSGRESKRKYKKKMCEKRVRESLPRHAVHVFPLASNVYIIRGKKKKSMDGKIVRACAGVPMDT